MNVIVNQIPLVGLPHESADRLTPRRQLLNQRHIQIAVHGQSHGTRNGRCRHDQYIRHQPALLLQLRPLGNTEAVLFVRHHQAQLCKRHTFLNQRMGADNDIHLLCGNPGIHFLPFLFRQPPRQKSYTNPQRFQLLHKTFVMLAGQNFSGRHKRSLIAVLHRLNQCQHGDYRFTGTNVSLYQPPHGQRAFHIPLDFLPGAALVLRQLKGQRFYKPPHQFTAEQMTNALTVLTRLPFQEQQAALNQIEFLKGQMIPRFF